MKGFFITGTDTGIGKTVLSALLLAELRRRGINAAPMKPVQTGCGKAPESNGGGLVVPDLDYSLSMAAMEVDAGLRKNMSPYRFEPACSPHLAAEMAGAEIDIAEMAIALRNLTSAYELVLAEGAGGVMVPLNSRETMLDLMQAFRLPALIAARPGLGTINHTLLTIRTLRLEGLAIAGVVFIASQPGEPGFIEEDNASTVERLGQVRVLGTLPYCRQLANEEAPLYEDLPIPVAAEAERIVNRLVS
jgi:dethiobiotin synthetase